MTAFCRALAGNQPVEEQDAFHGSHSSKSNNSEKEDRSHLEPIVGGAEAIGVPLVQPANAYPNMQM